MSYREWPWSRGWNGCDKDGCPSNAYYNGTWHAPGKSKKKLCWDHYQEALREEAAKDSPAVLAERERIAAALMAWYDMWQKPNRVAFTDKKVKPRGTVTTSWIKEFAEKIKDGTIGPPHGGREPEPLYET
jgi:hypothetical protein